MEQKRSRKGSEMARSYLELVFRRQQHAALRAFPERFQQIRGRRLQPRAASQRALRRRRGGGGDQRWPRRLHERSKLRISKTRSQDGSGESSKEQGASTGPPIPDSMAFIESVAADDSTAADGGAGADDSAACFSLNARSIESASVPLAAAVVCGLAAGAGAGADAGAGAGALSPDSIAFICKCRKLRMNQQDEKSS